MRNQTALASRRPKLPPGLAQKRVPNDYSGLSRFAVELDRAGQDCREVLRMAAYASDAPPLIALGAYLEDLNRASSPADRVEALREIVRAAKRDLFSLVPAGVKATDVAADWRDAVDLLEQAIGLLTPEAVRIEQRSAMMSRDAGEAA